MFNFISTNLSLYESILIFNLGSIISFHLSDC
jgi:hypothetical protein